MILRVGPFVADERTTTDPAKLGNNARLVAYAQFDPALRRLTGIIERAARERNGDEFHSVVARLFTFAGFYVDSLVADKSLTGKGIPDLIAHAPHEGWLLVVECTIGTLAGPRDKLSWLVTRARSVQEALASGSAERVLPVIVTALPSLPQHETEAARRSRVAVLTHGDLPESLRLGRDQAPVRTILSWFQAKVPAGDPMKLV